MSLLAVYLEECEKEKVSPNSLIRRMLPSNEGEELGQDELDLSKNFIGDRGLIPLLPVIEKSPRLKVIKIKDNGLRNKAVIALSAVLKTHPGVEELDLSNNFISTGAGRALEELVKENPRINVLNINGTKVDPEIRLRIQDFLATRK